MEKIITLNIPEWKHKRLLQKIEILKQAMRLFKINESFKKAYLDDIYAIESTIKNGGKNHGHNGYDIKANISSHSASPAQDSSLHNRS